MTLAHNLRDKAGVDELILTAEQAGANILKRPTDVFWGGYHGYFADPDGHIWEIAHNPFRRCHLLANFAGTAMKATQTVDAACCYGNLWLSSIRPRPMT